MERLTRGRVARMLGVSISTVRRMEGVTLHPVVGPDGTRVFDRAIVEAIARKPMRDVFKTPDRMGKGKNAIQRVSSARLRKYALLPQEYEAMLVAQENRCAICTMQFVSGIQPCIDHDHRSGRVRGILCAPCNLMLGNARDNVVYLRKAIDYLAMSKDQA